MPRKYSEEQAISVFHTRVLQLGDDDCWEWQAGRNDDGYGNTKWKGRSEKAHRVAYELAYGEFDRSLLVMHTCDNPSCCNPNHLVLGTKLDNNRDRARKGRSAPVHGEHNGCHKLTNAQVQEIRQKYTAKEANQYQLADEYGVSQPNVGYIVRRETWKE